MIRYVELQSLRPASLFIAGQESTSLSQSLDQLFGILIEQASLLHENNEMKKLNYEMVQTEVTINKSVK
jgi:hypothetical protein